MNHYQYADALYNAYRLRDPLGDARAQRAKAREESLREWFTDEERRQLKVNNEDTHEQASQEPPA